MEPVPPSERAIRLYATEGRIREVAGTETALSVTGEHCWPAAAELVVLHKFLSFFLSYVKKETGK